MNSQISVKFVSKLTIPKTQEPPKVIQTGNKPLSGVLVLPDGSIAVSSLNGDICLWDTTGKLVSKLPRKYLTSPGYDDMLQRCPDKDKIFPIALKSIHFVSKGKPSGRLATHGDCYVYFWDMPVFKKHHLKAHDDLVKAIAFTSNGNAMATTSNDGTTKLWPFSPNLMRTRHAVVSKEIDQKWGTSLEFAPDNKTLALGYVDNHNLGKVCFLPIGIDNQEFQCAKYKPLMEINLGRSQVNDLSFSPDGKLLAVASDNETLQLWNMKGEIVTELKGHHSRIFSVCFSPSGNMLATTSEDYTTILWSKEGTKLSVFNKGEWSRDAAFSTDENTLVTANPDKTAKIWSIQIE